MRPVNKMLEEAVDYVAMSNEGRWPKDELEDEIREYLDQEEPWPSSVIRERARHFIESFGISGWRVEAFEQEVLYFLEDDGDAAIHYDEEAF